LTHLPGPSAPLFQILQLTVYIH